MDEGANNAFKFTASLPGVTALAQYKLHIGYLGSIDLGKLPYLQPRP